jgi:RimJ/RimL family protein N-acetyltransferase
VSDLFPRTIETERLRLEPRSPASVDLREVYAVCSSDPGIEEVTRYVPWTPHETPRETREFLERGRTRFADGETADYVVRPRPAERVEDVAAPAVAGFAGLTPAWDRRAAELGIWLRKPYWGRGYSSERAFALAELAFEVLDLDLLEVTTHVDNENARRAIERYVSRMGGGRDGVFRNRGWVVDGEVSDLVRYSVSREAWRTERDGAEWPSATFHE